MELPKRPAYQSAIFNAERNQLELVNEHISSITRFIIIDNNGLSSEQLESIRFYVEDANQRTFNIDTLNNLIDPEKGESDKLHTPLLEGGIGAVEPLKFILKSDNINLEEYNFQISW